MTISSSLARISGDDAILATAITPRQAPSKPPHRPGTRTAPMSPTANSRNLTWRLRDTRRRRTVELVQDRRAGLVRTHACA